MKRTIMASVATLVLCLLALPVSALAADTTDSSELSLVKEPASPTLDQNHSPSMSDGADDQNDLEEHHSASMTCDENGVPIEVILPIDTAISSDDPEIPAVVSADIATAEATPKEIKETATPTILKLLSGVPFDAELQRRIFEEACHGDQVRFCLLMAIGNVESGFNPSARSGKTYGWLQVLSSSHRSRLSRLGYTTEDLLDPVKCSVVALDYLNGLMGYPSSLEVTHRLLMAYNMGAGGAAAAVKKGNTTSIYSRKVMPLYEKYLAEFTLG